MRNLKLETLTSIVNLHVGGLQRFTTHFAVFTVMNDGVHLPAIVSHEYLGELASDPGGQLVRLH